MHEGAGEHGGEDLGEGGGGEDVKHRIEGGIDKLDYSKVRL